MPPRWSRKPDRADPAYRMLDDRMNFAVHVAAYGAVNSGLWFFRILEGPSELGMPGGVLGTGWITAIWGSILTAHTLFLFFIAKYPEPAATSTAAKGFQPSSKAPKSAKRSSS
jgi:2TM domain